MDNFDSLCLQDDVESSTRSSRSADYSSSKSTIKFRTRHNNGKITSSYASSDQQIISESKSPGEIGKETNIIGRLRKHLYRKLEANRAENKTKKRKPSRKLSVSQISRPILDDKTKQSIWAGRGTLIELGSLGGENSIKVSEQDAILEPQWAELKKRMKEDQQNSRKRMESKSEFKLLTDTDGKLIEVRKRSVVIDNDGQKGDTNSTELVYYSDSEYSHDEDMIPDGLNLPYQQNRQSFDNQTNTRYQRTTRIQDLE